MPQGRIGIGVLSDAQKVWESIGRARVRSRIVAYAKTGTGDAPRGIPVEESANPWDALAQDLYAGKIDAAVRGTLPSGAALRSLKRVAAVDHLERAALLEDNKGHRFLLAPVGIDEGWTVVEKVGIAKRARDLACRLGLAGEVAILSGGRLSDAGRHPRVDESLSHAELVSRLTGFPHLEILIEDAVERCSVVIAPDGICGNLIFRTLVLVGGGRGCGAPVLNIDRVFIDTSRASPDYANALRLAEFLAGTITSGN
ncbi:MAG: methanogenesis marker protein Mmp4/MtxX [Methanolinea sp.]|nr:methanogenesis marker protein Mmp4/MtxX [Methanolinea sp.]